MDGKFLSAETPHILGTEADLDIHCTVSASGCPSVLILIEFSTFVSILIRGTL